jgi:hypothetical protein
MPQQHAYTSALYSLDTPRAEFQVVVTHGNIVLDVQTRHFASDGHEHRQYAIADLSLKDATRLVRLLNEAIAASGNATAVAVADELRRAWRLA